MTGFPEAMKVYNPILQQRQDVCDELAKMPFWSLLKTYMDGTLITSERKRKCNMDLIKIINCYNPTNQNNNVVQIFGLNNEGIDLPNTDKSTKFGDDDRLIKKYFTDVKVVKKKHLAKAYEKALEDETPENAQDIVSFICAHLVQSLLMIHKAIKDIPVEKIKNVINNDERNDQNVNKNTEKTDELENISTNEAQIEFNKLFGKKMIKLDATVQKYIIGMNTIMSEELFDEFKKARSIAEKRYITFIEKLLQKVEVHQKKNNAHNAKMLKMQTKTSIGNLKNKFKEAQSKTLNYKKEPSPVPHAVEIQVEMKTPTVELMSNGAEMEDVQKDVNEEKQYVAKGKERTRTLVQNVHARDDRK
ncbi:signal recognition particle subunit SRP68-like [Pyrus ussuriensis x Pyrus communis]|uniref:Signal recognition particle subunit SRP68-like n=1 Tax=Pyrus ussuriensis x Pyrus communis TaxID=2448454 RepID=A0A5N5HH73_9ROSA|nr:signal recognition particle subunit SRP68-like [Pyrus ussuriensis x Pyrus communis]